MNIKYVLKDINLELLKGLYTFIMLVYLIFPLFHCIIWQASI